MGGNEEGLTNYKGWNVVYSDHQHSWICTITTTTPPHIASQGDPNTLYMYVLLHAHTMYTYIMYILCIHVIQAILIYVSYAHN